jgi:aspartokinase
MGGAEEMTTEELAAIEKRANERKTAHQIDAVEAMAKSQADVPDLVAEVRRLKGYEEIVLKMMHERQRAMLEAMGEDA